MKILVAAICIGLQIISAQTTEPASIAVTGEPPEGKTPPRELWVPWNRGNPTVRYSEVSSKSRAF